MDGMDPELLRLIFLLSGAALLISLVVAVFLVFIRRRVAGQTVVSRQRSDATRPDMVACPFCTAQMEPGHTVSPNGIFWYSRKRKLKQANPLWNALPNTINMGFKSRGNRAWHCEKCRVLFIDHSEMVEQNK